MSEVFTTPCPLCADKKGFKSRKALQTHYDKHPGHDLGFCVFFRNDADRIEVPMPKKIKGVGKAKYLDWLSVLVECINSAHYPRAPGKV